MAVCTGCSLLCEDIEVSLDGGHIKVTKNLCRKGLGRFRSLEKDRASPMIGGSSCTLDEAFARAGEILREARRPLIFGWSSCTLEGQRAGLDLARKLGAVVDDTSSFCQGLIMERVLKGALPTCTLDDVRNYADMSVFWGSDPSSSHPRHLSRFSYFPRGDKRQRGYEEDRTAIVIDVRKSPTASIAGDGYHRVPPKGDGAFIDSLLAVLEGKMPKFGDKKRMISLGTTLKKAEFGTIFPGLGLLYSIKEEMGKLDTLVKRLNEVSKYHVIPMVGHYNMRGFNQMLMEETGYINRVSFAAGSEPEHGSQNSVVESLKTADAVLVMGSDPISSLPGDLARRLAALPTVVLDPHKSLTAEMAQVVIPTALSGLEAGGSAIRMDGVKVSFEPVVESHLPTDAAVLARIGEVV